MLVEDNNYKFILHINLRLLRL